MTKTAKDTQWADLASRVKAKQDALVSGMNIKTINNTSLLGSGDIAVGGDTAVVITLSKDGASWSGQLLKAIQNNIPVTIVSVSGTGDYYEQATSIEYEPVLDTAMVSVSSYSQVARYTLSGVTNGSGNCTSIVKTLPSLSSSTSSTSTTTAATSSAVKSAYDLANTANTTASSKASITLSTTDIGEGATLTANTLYGVYE